MVWVELPSFKIMDVLSLLKLSFRTPLGNHHRQWSRNGWYGHGDGGNGRSHCNLERRM